MIVPAGKRKHQVNQGVSQYESLMDSDIFEKIAIGNLPGQLPGQVTNQVDTGPIGDAMSQGGLNRDRRPQDPNADLGVAGKHPNSIAPSGTPKAPKPSGVPADQFLGPAPVDDQQTAVDPYEEERQKIRQFVGYDNFGVDLTPGKDGTLEVTLIPPQGTPVDVGGLLQGLQQHLGGKWGGESTPSRTTGGPIKFKYIPQSMATNEKVTKAKGGR